MTDGASKRREDFRRTGEFKQIDRYPSGRRRGLIVGTAAPQGGTSVDPGVSFAHLFRARMKPIRIAPCIVTDASGQVVARIEVDPVTGERRRVDQEQETKKGQKVRA